MIEKKTEADKKIEKQLEALKGAIGILHNKVTYLEGHNRSLDALVRKTSQQLQHTTQELQNLKAHMSNRG